METNEKLVARGYSPHKVVEALREGTGFVHISLFSYNPDSGKLLCYVGDSRVPSEFNVEGIARTHPSVRLAK